MKKAKIIFSDSTCCLDGNYYENVPALIGPDFNIIDAVTDWFRHLLTSNLELTSVHQYAYTMANYWNFLISRRCAWTDANDSLLKKWRNLDGEIGNNLERKTVNAKLTTVYRFYLWAQSNNYIFEVIGIPSLALCYRPAISLESGGNGNFSRISSNLLYRVPGHKFKPVPTSSEMDDAFAVLSRTKNPGLAERNILMLRWAAAVGLRRAEFLSLSIAQLPTMAKILDLDRQGLTYQIEVIGKGNKKRVVPVQPDLIVNTLDYVETWRQQVVELYPASIQINRIFISHTSGSALSLPYVSGILSKAFADSERHLTVHRARARFITKLVAKFLEEHIELHGSLNTLSVELLLLRATEIVGHSNLNSLKYYLDQELKARQQKQLR